MAQSGVYSESGIDYLKRVVQVVDLEFKIKPETKGSSTYLYSCTTGINRDSKDMAPSSNKPVRVEGLINRRILSISCGDNHTIALVAGMQNSCQMIEEEHGQVMIDVLGWGENSLGQVSGNQKVERYNQPVVISEFVGKKIINVSCYRAKSCAIELGGNIYEWGGVEAAKIRVTRQVDEAQEMHHGNNFTIVRTIDKLYFWGEIRNKARNIITERDASLVSGNLKISRVSVGYDHALASDKDGKLYCFGSNEFSQLGIEHRVDSTRRFIPAEYFSSPVKNFWALNQVSIVSNSDFEHQYIGLVKKDPLKIAKYPEDFQLPGGVRPHKLSYVNNQIYGLGSNGSVYLWDNRVAIGFKEENISQEKFNDIYLSKGFMLLQKPFISPEVCKITCTSSDPMTYMPVEMKIEVVFL